MWILSETQTSSPLLAPHFITSGRSTFSGSNCSEIATSCAHCPRSSLAPQSPVVAVGASALRERTGISLGGNSQRQLWSTFKGNTALSELSWKFLMTHRIMVSGKTWISKSCLKEWLQRGRFLMWSCFSHMVTGLFSLYFLFVYAGEWHMI